MLTDEMRYKLMRVLQENPEMSQRAVGISKRAECRLRYVNGTYA